MKFPPRVLPVTPGRCSITGVAALLGDLAEIKAAGAEGVLLREHDLSDSEMLELARAARELFCDGWLGVHDRLHIATLVGADAVHLGHRSMPVDVVAEATEGAVAIGVSHHLPELKLSSMAASYRFLGPVFAPISKPLYGEELGVSALQEASLKSQTWALGGVRSERLSVVFEAGVAGVAAIGEIFGGGAVGLNMERLISQVDCFGGQSV